MREVGSSLRGHSRFGLLSQSRQVTFGLPSLPTLPSPSFSSALLFFFLCLLSSNSVSPSRCFPCSLVGGGGHQAQFSQEGLCAGREEADRLRPPQPPCCQRAPSVDSSHTFRFKAHPRALLSRLYSMKHRKTFTSETR